MELHINATSACKHLGLACAGVSDRVFLKPDKLNLQRGSRYVRLDPGNISVKVISDKGHGINVS